MGNCASRKHKNSDNQASNHEISINPKPNAIILDHSKVNPPVFAPTTLSTTWCYSPDSVEEEQPPTTHVPILAASDSADSSVVKSSPTRFVMDHPSTSQSTADQIPCKMQIHQIINWGRSQHSYGRCTCASDLPLVCLLIGISIQPIPCWSN
jgi:hypothetical protein